MCCISDDEEDEQYISAYLEGWSDAHTERTAEALALVRTLWRKLTRARNERDQLLTDVGDHYGIVRAIAKRNSELYTQHLTDQKFITILRSEVERLQRELLASSTTRENSERQHHVSEIGSTNATEK